MDKENLINNPRIIVTQKLYGYFLKKESNESSTHYIEGVFILFPSNIDLLNFFSEANLNIFGIGHNGVYCSNLWTALGPRIIIPCWASPPNTFCQEKVVTSSLLHGRSIASTADVASHKVKPDLFSSIQSPFGTFTPAVVPFHVKTTSLLKLTFSKSGK